MKIIDEDLAVIHAYLCADGYVIKNPPTQKNKYYVIGFRNTNSNLLKDFHKRFNNYFGISTRFLERERCVIGNKEIYHILTKNFGSFYSWEWSMPKLDKNLIKLWLRAYFDCEGWVTCISHQNRAIGLCCVNEKGIIKIVEALKILGIEAKYKKRNTRNIFSLNIFGKDNLIKFRNKVGFLHPKKNKNLEIAINDYVKYLWEFPENEKSLRNFVKNIIKDKIRFRKDKFYARIISNKKQNLTRLKKELFKFFEIKSRVYKSKNGCGTIYYTLMIKNSEVNKLLRFNLLNKELRQWLKSKK